MRPICSIEGCETLINARGLCPKHYQRLMKYGSAVGGARNHAPPDVRFARYYKKAGENECWDWFGKKEKNGYGRFQVGGKGSAHIGAHRYAHQLATGENPQVVMHTCDRPSCVNPSHLKAGTYKENTADMMRKQRDGASKLKPDQVREIRKQIGSRCALLAVEYSISESAIWAIWRGESWKHIE